MWSYLASCWPRCSGSCTQNSAPVPHTHVLCVPIHLIKEYLSITLNNHQVPTPAKAHVELVLQPVAGISFRNAARILHGTHTEDAAMLLNIVLDLLGLKWYDCVYLQLGKHGAALEPLEIFMKLWVTSVWSMWMDKRWDG